MPVGRVSVDGWRPPRPLFLRAHTRTTGVRDVRLHQQVFGCFSVSIPWWKIYAVRVLGTVLCGVCGLVISWAARTVVDVAAGSAVPAWIGRWLVPDLLTALLFAVAYLRIGLIPELPVVCYVIALGVWLSIVDCYSRQLPDVLTLPSYAVVGLTLALIALFRSDWTSLGRAAAGMVIAVAIFWVLFAVGGVGLGDVKLAGVLGGALAWFGWPNLIASIALGFVFSGFAALVLALAGRVDAATRIPFGPYIIGGALVALLW